MRSDDLHQVRPHPPKLIVIGRVAGQVRQLGWIGLAVEELLEAAVGPPDVLVAFLDQRQLAIFLVAEDAVDRLPRVATGDHVGQGRRRADIRWKLGAGGAEHERHQLLLTGQGVDVAGRPQVQLPPHRLRRPDDEWDVRGFLVEIALEEKVVVAHQVAVIGVEDDDRVVTQTESVQHAQQASDAVIQVGDVAVVERACERDLLGSQRVPSVLKVRAAELRRALRHVLAVAPRLRNVGGRINLVIGARRVVGRVRLGEAAMQVEGALRLGCLVSVEKADRLVGGPGGDVVGFRDRRWRGKDVVVTDAVGTLQAGPGRRLQPVVVVVTLRHTAFFADHRALEAVQGALIGREVELAGAMGAIAVPGQHAGQRVLRVHRVSRVAKDPVRPRMLTRHPRRPRRHAHGRLAVAAGEVIAVARQRVERGGLQPRLTRDAQGVAALLVGGDEENVGSLRGHAGTPGKGLEPHSRLLPAV